MSSIWRNWLVIWSWAVIAFGALLAGAAFPATDAPVRMLMGVMHGEAPPAMDAYLRFGVALLGAVSIGWGVVMLGVMQVAFRMGAEAAPIWRAITTGVVIWYVVDSALSVTTGFALNAASNTALLVGYIIPIFASQAMQPRTGRSAPAGA
jgi:hypothetical protein